MISAVASIHREIDRAGFATSVHRMGDYVEFHAVPLPNAETVHVARVQGDTDATAYLAACELARMCGIELNG
jgi:hypothetical protein